MIANLAMANAAKAVLTVLRRQPHVVTAIATKAVAMLHAVLPVQMQVAVHHVVHVVLLKKI